MEMDLINIGIVLEDNIWRYGDPKTKAKIYIPLLSPMESRDELSSTINIKRRIIKNAKLQNEKINYIEVYIPDSIYTIPQEFDILNDDMKIRGAKKNDPRLDGTNGRYINNLTRIVPKNTRLLISFMDPSDESEIKIIGKADDYEEEKIKLNGGDLYGIDTITYKSALR